MLLEVDGHFWCPVCSKSTLLETADKFTRSVPLSWKTFHFPCKLPYLRIISISFTYICNFWTRTVIKYASFPSLLNIIVMAQFNFYIFCDSVRVERFAVKKLYKVACLLLMDCWLRKCLFAWRRKAIQVLKLSSLGFTSWYLPINTHMFIMLARVILLLPIAKAIKGFCWDGWPKLSR